MSDKRMFNTQMQLLSKGGGRASLALGDFVAPAETGLGDYVGGFVVTSGAEEEVISKRIARANDD